MMAFTGLEHGLESGLEHGLESDGLESVFKTVAAPIDIPYKMMVS